MKTTFAVTTLFLVCVASSGVSNAQQTTTQQQGATQQYTQQNSTQQQGQDTSQQAQNGVVANQPAVVKKVGFRLANWRTVHGDGTKATTDMVATLQKIGCEVKQDNHGGHVDISFRCPSWKTHVAFSPLFFQKRLFRWRDTSCLHVITIVLIESFLRWPVKLGCLPGGHLAAM